MQKLPISVYYIVKNEEIRFPRSLKSVADWANEIIAVIDPRTTDNTADIAKEFGCKIFYNEWKGFAVQKKFAESQCSNKWVFNIDADEEISTELQLHIQEIFKDGRDPEESGFLTTVIDMFPFDTKPRRFARKYEILRIYDKTKGTIPDKEFSIDDRARLSEGKTKLLKEPIYHRTIIDLTHLETKFSNITKDQAMYIYSNGKNVSSFKLYTYFFAYFFKYYLLKKHCLLGWYGFVISIMSAYKGFMKLAKAKEMYVMAENNKSLNK